MITTIIFDLDGTLYLGEHAIDGAARTLEKLRSVGKKLFFLSNAATRSRKQQLLKLRGMGMVVHHGEVYNSAYATACYIEQNHPGKKVFVICEGGVQKELKLKGIIVAGAAQAEVVAIGLDRNITWNKIAAASLAIRRGAVFIGTNPDPAYPTKKGLMPGAGAIIAAVETAAGKKPDIILGKPHTFLLEEIAKEHTLKKEEILIVGDRYESDILAAKNFGIKSAAVLTGVITQDDIAKLKEKPDYVLNSVDELPTLLSTL